MAVEAHRQSMAANSSSFGRFPIDVLPAGRLNQRILSSRSHSSRLTPSTGLGLPWSLAAS